MMTYAQMCRAAGRVARVTGSAWIDALRSVLARTEPYTDAKDVAEWWGAFCYERRVMAMHGESGLY